MVQDTSSEWRRLRELAKTDRPVSSSEKTPSSGERSVALRRNTAVGTASGRRALARTMQINRGLYALKYLAAHDVGTPALVTVAFAPDSEGGEFFWAPDTQPGVLRQPGDTVVMSSLGSSLLVVTIFLLGPASEDTVKLKLDRIDGLSERDIAAVKGSGATQPVQVPDQPDEEIEPIYLSGHIAYKGDMTAAPGKWLGSPEEREQIEGFTVHWPRRPVGTDISYGCTIGGRAVGAETVTGDFTGTRKRGLPLTSIFFRLRDEGAERFELQLTAAFSDGTIIKDSGQNVSASGNSALAFLVGVCLLLQRKKLYYGDDKPKADDSRLHSGRTRLYRSGGIEPQARQK